VSRFIFCDRCETDRGVVFEREDERGCAVDFVPHDPCPHLSAADIVADLEALYSGESILPVTLRRAAPLAAPVDASA
jgi:hypothetical protein